MKINFPKSSTVLFFIIVLFLFFSFISYKLLLQNLEDNHFKNQEISFYKIQRETSNLLTKLFYKYSHEKDTLLEKHKEVLEYLENHSYDISLNEIHNKINEGITKKPYHIYITDENLVIKNSTYKADLGFDLSFAKDLFEEHKKSNSIGLSPPIFEIFSGKFFSYSDSSLAKNKKRVLQISYTHDDLDEDLENLINLLNQNKEIKESNAFIAYSDGYIGDFIFKSLKSNKPTLEEIEERIKKGKKLSKFIDEDKYINSHSFKKNLHKNSTSYLSEKSPIFDEAKIIYTISFDETIYLNSILRLNLIMLFIAFIGILTIYIIYKVRYKENLLSYKDKFIEHSVHEIKTPLSILVLNSQLRNKAFGEDKYSKKIEGALKTLENSYDDISFLHTRNKINYIVENLSLKDILENRVTYFKVIADTQNRNFDLQISNDIFIELSQIELNRLIDNNLSNAIKYSNIGSFIKVILKNNTLEFHSIGNQIIDTNNIFKKYSRENESVGGHGLGLSIVKDICEKYDISIKVTSLENNTNVFSYTFKCHSIDTQ